MGSYRREVARSGYQVIAGGTQKLLRNLLSNS